MDILYAPAVMPAPRRKLSMFDRALMGPARADAMRKLDPRVQWRNPVMLVVYIGSILTTALWVQALIGRGAAPPAFIFNVAIWLWFTVLFANFAEALAEGRGKAQAAALRGLTPITVTALVSLLVRLIPTTIGGLLSAIGVAGMSRMLQANVIASSGRAVEAAGDVDVLLLDKTGTITLGNRPGWFCCTCRDLLEGTRELDTSQAKRSPSTQQQGQSSGLPSGSPSAALAPASKSTE
jgi:high-affinity K+ transport system ATPase subunit B